MRLLSEENEEKTILDKEEIEITINYIMNIKSIRIAANIDDNDTIKTLKSYLTNIVDASIEEQTLLIQFTNDMLDKPSSFPYPLIDELKLCDLLEHHRVLILIISEKPDKVIPKRLLTKIKENIILNLRNVHEYDIKYIMQWMNMINGVRSINIELDWKHPLFSSIVNEITDYLEYSLDDYYFHPIRIRSIDIYNKENKEYKDDNNKDTYKDNINEKDSIKDKEESINNFIKKISEIKAYKRINIKYIM